MPGVEWVQPEKHRFGLGLAMKPHVSGRFVYGAQILQIGLGCVYTALKTVWSRFDHDEKKFGEGQKKFGKTQKSLEKVWSWFPKTPKKFTMNKPYELTELLEWFGQV